MVVVVVGWRRAGGEGGGVEPATVAAMADAAEMAATAVEAAAS
jgi:hypothetical protein